MYGLGLFIVVLTRTTKIFKYDVARQVSKPHMPAKFHDLVSELCCLNSKKVKKIKNFGAYGRIGIFYLTPFPFSYLHTFLVSGVI